MWSLMRERSRASLRRMLFLARAEVLHMVRDRGTLAQVVALPVIQLLVLANAATFQIRGTPTYVVDLDHTTTSRGLVERMASSGHFRIVGRSESMALAEDMLLRGRATMTVMIPHHFEASLVRTGRAPVQLSINAEKGVAAGIVQGYAARIMAAYGSEAMARLRPAVPPATGAGRIELLQRYWYNPTLDYRHYMVPGILVALVTMIGTLLGAQNIVREREAGTLEQLNVTPITRGEFIFAKLLPLWVLALGDLAIGLVVGRVAFGIPMRGSLVLLFAAAGVYLVAALAIGLWISTVVETQQQAMFVTYFIVMIYLLMSGLLTPLDSMPGWARAVSMLNPVRHFVTIARGVLVKGAGARELGEPLLVLVVYAGGVLWIAVRRYSKRTA